MFTGIIEKMGVVKKIIDNKSNKTFWIKSPISSKLKVDQSVSHDGVCLTIEEIKTDQHRVTAVAETLSKTMLGNWQPGHIVNIERCMKLNDRLDGHLVQGHADATATCIGRTEKDGSWEFRFEFPVQFADLIVEKGSITLNGISLTAFNVSDNSFDVAIVPYTFENTNIKEIAPGAKANLEFDILGKYINRKLSLNK